MYSRPNSPRYPRPILPPLSAFAHLAFLQVPLERFFPEYTGGSDVNKGAKYILWRFMQANRARLNVYPQFVISLSHFPTLSLTWMQYYTSYRHV
jgi:hypothetical protein